MSAACSWEKWHAEWKHQFQDETWWAEQYLTSVDGWRLWLWHGAIFLSDAVKYVIRILLFYNLWMWSLNRWHSNHSLNIMLMSCISVSPLLSLLPSQGWGGGVTHFYQPCRDWRLTHRETRRTNRNDTFCVGAHCIIFYRPIIVVFNIMFPFEVQ